MNGIDNIAGYTLTVGTADFVITDSIAQYDPIIDNLTDGDERNYKAQFIDPSFGDDYETGRGTWNAGAGTISRTTIKTSSNNGSIVNFGAGPKVVFIVSDYESLTDMNNMVDSAVGAGSLKMTTAERATIAGLGDSSSLDVGTTAGTVAAGDDGRFGAVDYGDLPVATTLDGNEIVAVDQGGDGVQTTSQDISGTPVTDVSGLALNRVRGYSDFSKTLDAYVGVTNTLFSLEPYIVNFAGTSSAANQGASISGIASVLLSTGTAATGNSAIRLAGATVTFLSTQEYTATFLLSTSVLSGAETGHQQIGFSSTFPALVNLGMYFEQTDASANWFACVKNAGGTERVDTLITSVIAVPQTYRIHYDPVATATKFYIDGTLVATILNSTRVLADATPLYQVLMARKTGGANPPALFLASHSYDIPKIGVSGSLNSLEYFA